MSTHELQVFDSIAMPWEERFVPQLGKALRARLFCNSLNGSSLQAKHGMVELEEGVMQ
jgi:hypothetical protein